jgi:hypothetical protein
MKSRTNQAPVLSRYDVQPGQTYPLKQLSYGVRFALRGRIYETVTHPPIWTGTRPGCLRDCWDVLACKMVQVDYQVQVRAA